MTTRNFALTDDKPLTCVSYVGIPPPEVILDPVAVGDVLPAMPLFLTPDIYVPRPWKPPTNRPGRLCRLLGRCSPPLIARRRVAGSRDA